MTSTKQWVVAMVVVGLVGCASPGSEKDQMKTYVSEGAASALTQNEEGGDSGKKAEEDNVICRTVERVGSHMKERHCYTVSEREEARKRTQDEMRRRVRRSPIESGGPPL